MAQDVLEEDNVARFDYLSRTPYPTFYRTPSVTPTILGGQSDTTLQVFIAVFTSSSVCRRTLKNKLREILVKGSFKAWNPSSNSATPSYSIVPRGLFDQDLNQVVLRELSRTRFESFTTAATRTRSDPVSLLTLSQSNLYSKPTNSSHHSTPAVAEDNMCFKYKCVACKKAKYDYCKEYLENFEERKWCDVEEEEPWGSQLKQCHTCRTVTGAIKELKALVFREPWLETEGVAGAPEKAAWEVEEGGVKGVEEEEDDDDPDGWTKEERKELRRKAEEEVARRWGLMKAEQAAEEEAAKKAE